MLPLARWKRFASLHPTQTRVLKRLPGVKNGVPGICCAPLDRARVLKLRRLVGAIVRGCCFTPFDPKEGTETTPTGWYSEATCTASFHSTQKRVLKLDGCSWSKRFNQLPLHSTRRRILKQEMPDVFVWFVEGFTSFGPTEGTETALLPFPATGQSCFTLFHLTGKY
jgi:hypothetical protein